MQLVNVRTVGGVERFRREGGIYIGRPSPLGNPFRIGVHGTRKQVIEQYRQWLWAQLKAGNESLKQALLNLKETDRLGCWCCPAECHGEVIIRAARWLKSK